ncbi:hypothetical protein ET445_04285 [Agromyces protaetiae]|uniref:Alpha/beta hydrolase n=1 Tax=Agromyces protaetiae TaxID=2509455 RepID=A0A4P6F9S9_9MICO|nr:hypothetical protein [Agromyces protaetiae]QAY72682.1 hypothetical protein ET445_04285 [Agromyces protaetiae]
MSDDLTITTGGGTRVADEDLLAEAFRLGAIRTTVVDWCDRVARIRRGLEHDGFGDVVAAMSGGYEPTWALRDAESKLTKVAGHCEDLCSALDQAAKNYGATERAIKSIFDLGVRWAAATAAYTFPLWAEQAAVVGGILWGASAIGLWDPKATQSQLMNQPWFVEFVRSASGAVDEVALARAGVPPLLAVLLGQRTETPQNAAILMGLAGAAALVGSKAFVETPITVRRADGAPANRLMGVRSAAAPKPATVPPPDGFEDLAERVPEADDGDPQIVVEVYGEGDDKRFVVYVTGTIDWSMVPGGQPLDFTNDVSDVADDSGFDMSALAGYDSSAASRAVRAALEQSGWSPEDRFMAVGFSGGGAAVADLISDPSLNAVAGVTFGAPTAQTDTGEVPLVNFAHAEDLVPATAGRGVHAPGVIELHRNALDPDGEYDPVAAHSMPLYSDTAALADRSESPEVQEARALVQDFVGDEPGTRIEFIAERRHTVVPGPAIDPPPFDPDFSKMPGIALGYEEGAAVSPSTAAR